MRNYSIVFPNFHCFTIKDCLLVVVAVHSHSSSQCWVIVVFAQRKVLRFAVQQLAKVTQRLAIDGRNVPVIVDLQKIGIASNILVLLEDV